MIFEGNTQGFGGTYLGTADIRFALGSFRQAMKNDTFSIHSEAPSLASYDEASVKVNFTFSGYGSSSFPIGNFSGSVFAVESYSFENHPWLITNEVWNFESFFTEYSCGGGC